MSKKAQKQMRRAPTNNHFFSRVAKHNQKVHEKSTRLAKKHEQSITANRILLESGEAVLEEYHAAGGDNSKREEFADFIRVVSHSLPNPQVEEQTAYKTRRMRSAVERDKSLVKEHQPILNGAYILTILAIKQEVAKSWNIFKKDRNSELYKIVGERLGGIGTDVSAEDVADWLDALKEHLSKPEVRYMLEQNGVDIDKFERMLDTQLEEFAPKSSVTP